MYKLFLCLKFLRRRYLALIAVAAIALCVAMVLIVVSVMDGFVGKSEMAAKGIYGEILVKPASISGIGYYDEFISELTGRYRIQSEYKFISVGPAPSGPSAGSGQVTAVFEGAGGQANAEMLTGAFELPKPVTVDAVGLVYSKGRLLREATGKATLSEQTTPAEAPDKPAKRNYTVRFEAALPAAAQSPDAELALHTLYAITGKGMPEIQAASPIIYSVGLLRIGSEYTTNVRICGIRLPERLAVTDMASGLFVQKDWPDATFSPSDDAMLDASQHELEKATSLLEKELSLPPSRQDAEQIRRLQIATTNLTITMSRLKNAADYQNALKDELARPAGQQDKPTIELLQKQLDDSQKRSGLSPNHMIFGLAIEGMSVRTEDGSTIRLVTPGEGGVTLETLPIGRGRGTIDVTPVIRTFTMVDDAKTDVYVIDSETVYVPFEMLQTLLEMTEISDLYDPTLTDPARCSQINIKVRPPYDSPARLIEVRRKVEQAWADFGRRHPNATAAQWPVQVTTWRQEFAKVIGSIEKQRTLVTTMFGIISFVSVLLIFAIFYMIVVQKTRDIGVIRAVGGSGAGVAEIFLAFGAATGLLGSAIGITIGWLFVVYINEMQDWLAVWTGFRVWDREFFMFDKIPNHVDPAVAVAIAAWAILSGLVGALIPGVRAAVMEPAEAIRYE